ncbi:TIGR04282 family arsenosugar biosynthesis glycosyltransferase [Methyloceanibacter sp.]|uniref:TIGR04282 family arsenosugar biosynthesis glycosyltransferase n=1 Tax=Methyloceanibacter sp. TaxID=1965321 RepID=UPI003D6D5D97
MAKSPLAGRGKRRLAASIGAIQTARFYRSCLAHTLMRLGPDSRWRTLLAVSPDSDRNAAFWPLAIERLAQGHGDLGAKMQRLFRLLPPGPAIIVGSDIPSIKASDIARAFRLLGGAEAVFGPAPDGGYWLVGLRRSPRLLAPFAGVRWSSPHALADTLGNLKGSRVAFAATLSDVDTEDDHRRMRRDWERLIPPKP